jgi:tetratricopeptide (TPR) repeat protein
MLTAYVDCSGSADDPGVRALAMGGCIARDDQWQQFERAWRDALSAESVTMLHLRDFTQSTGEFVAWKEDPERRARFLSSLASIINRSTEKRFLVGLFLDDYRSLNATHNLREVLGRPYTALGLYTVALIDDWVKQNHPGEEVRYLFEKGDPYQGDLIAAVQNGGRAWKRTAPVFVPKRAALPDGTVSYCLPFQAADFIAYEMQKAIADWTAKGKDKLRMSARALFPQEPDRYARFLDRDILLMLSRRVGLAPRGRRTPRTPKRSATSLEKAEAHHLARRDMEAIRDVTRAIEEDPTNARAFALRASTFVNIRRGTEALADASRAVELDGQSSSAHAELARALGTLGRHAEAIVAADRALALDATNSVAYLAKASALGNSGQASEGLLAADRAAELEPDNGLVHLIRATALGNLGRHAEALVAATRAADLEPGSPLIAATRARVILRLGRFEEALEGAADVLEMDPQNALALEVRRLAMIALRGRG